MKKVKQYFLNKPSKYKNFEFVCNWLVIVLPIIWLLGWFLILPIAEKNRFVEITPWGTYRDSLSGFEAYLITATKFALSIGFWLWIGMVIFKIVRYIMRRMPKKSKSWNGNSDFDNNSWGENDDDY